MRKCECVTLLGLYRQRPHPDEDGDEDGHDDRHEDGDGVEDGDGDRGEDGDGVEDADDTVMHLNIHRGGLASSSKLLWAILFVSWEVRWPCFGAKLM